MKKSRQPKPYMPYRYKEPDHNDWMNEARYQLNWLYDRKAAWEILLFVAADFPE